MLGIRKRLFIKRVVGHLSRLPRELVIAPLKKYLINALRHMVLLLGGPGWSQELDLMILVGPF